MRRVECRQVGANNDVEAGIHQVFTFIRNNPHRFQDLNAARVEAKALRSAATGKRSVPGGVA